MNMEKTDFLAELALFRDLPADLRQLVSTLFEDVAVEDDALVFRTGDAGEYVFAVREGQVVLFTDRVGEPVELKARIGPGEVFGEVAVLQGGGRTLTARAVGPTRLLRLEGRKLLELAGAHEELALRLSKIALGYSFENRSSKAELARRKEARVRLGARVELRTEGKEPIAVVLENLSLGGASLSGLPIGWEIEESRLISIGVDPRTALLSVYARVAWRKQDRLGIAFTRTLADHPLRVAGALHRLTGLLLSSRSEPRRSTHSRLDTS